MESKICSICQKPTVDYQEFDRGKKGIEIRCSGCSEGLAKHWRKGRISGKTFFRKKGDSKTKQGKDRIKRNALGFDTAKFDDPTKINDEDFV